MLYLVIFCVIGDLLIVFNLNVVVMVLLFVSVEVEVKMMF